MQHTPAPEAPSRHLDAKSVERYRREGFLAPLPVMAEAEMEHHFAALREVEVQRGGRLAPVHNIKAHLLVPSLWDLVHDSRVLDPVEDLLGPDLLCWGAGFFDKRPGEPGHIPWHQDATYWGLSAPEAVTAWIAFTPSLRRNGCMRVDPCSHTRQLPHGDTRDRTNMLPGREVVLVDVEEARAVDVELRPGEMSLHHVLLVHGSQRNRSDLRRCGFAIRYIPAHLTNRRDVRSTATLVRGRDHGHFDPEQAPQSDFHPAAMARYTEIARHWMRGVFDGMAHETKRDGEPR